MSLDSLSNSGEMRLQGPHHVAVKYVKIVPLPTLALHAVARGLSGISLIKEDGPEDKKINNNILLENPNNFNKYWKAGLTTKVIKKMIAQLSKQTPKMQTISKI